VISHFLPNDRSNPFGSWSFISRLTFSREPTIVTRQSPGLKLDAFFSHGWNINQVEAVAVFGQYGREHAWDNASELTWSRTTRVPVIHSHLQPTFLAASLSGVRRRTAIRAETNELKHYWNNSP